MIKLVLRALAMNRIVLSQMDEASKASLEEAVALVDRFFVARGSTRRLTLDVDGSLTISGGEHEALRGGRPGRISLVVGGFPAPSRRFAALTWGRTIHFRPIVPASGTPALSPSAQNTLFFYGRSHNVRPATSMAALLVHELEHVEQQHRAFLGLAGFLTRYLVNWVLGGFRYRNISYEKAAKEVQEEARGYFASLS